MSYLPVKKAIKKMQLADLGRMEAIVNVQSDKKSIDDSIVSHPHRKRKNRCTKDMHSEKRNTTEKKMGFKFQSGGSNVKETVIMKMVTRAVDGSSFDLKKKQYTINDVGSRSLAPLQMSSREIKHMFPVTSTLRRSSRLFQTSRNVGN